MVRKVGFVCFCLLTIYSFAGAELKQAENLLYEPSELKSDETENILESILSGESIRLQRDEVVVEDPLADFWRGNRPIFDTRLKELVVEFEHAQDKEKTFAVTIVFDDKNLILRNSAAQRTQYAGGVRVPYDRSETTRLLLMGMNHMSIAVFVGAGSKVEETYTVLCPRSYRGTQLPGGRKSLTDTGYQVSSIKPVFHAQVAARLLTGRSQGYGRADIKTSKGLTPASPHFIEKTDRDPQLNLEYQSPKDEDFHPQDVLDFSKDSVTSGVRTTLELVLPAGQKRTNKSSSSVSVRSATFDESATVRLQNSEVLLGSGSCYLLSNSKEQSVSYSKGLPVESE